MRYHWGLGIGHTYSHISSQKYPASSKAPTEDSVNPLEDIDSDSDSELPECLLPDTQDLPVNSDGNTLQDEYNDDLEERDSEPEDQDVDVDATGSQVGESESAAGSEDAFDGCSDFNGDEDDDLELYDTYHSD